MNNNSVNINKLLKACLSYLLITFGCSYAFDPCTKKVALALFSCRMSNILVVSTERGPPSNVNITYWPPGEKEVIAVVFVNMPSSLISLAFGLPATSIARKNTAKRRMFQDHRLLNRLRWDILMRKLSLVANRPDVALIETFTARSSPLVR